MSAATMYDEEHFVVLETNQSEAILTATELSEKLRSILATQQDELPTDIKQAGGIDEQIRYLIDTTCELGMAPGEYLQWYAIRLEK
ncbi:chlororespiratory reduction protein 7 [Leptolyngbya sp. FACHB-17]|uniref:chlororespiratory reduction protein 7 n=1 Tax=unclassified Leptolyngbya TaxID=2650499 RepID=UPI0016803500|nr:chlororespiratory reduction protein 7 [Leptolyngbya sp. FACHB-17]MBD2081591.1 chlororespiratory reduction protein 7 [Leptolyngbya sp. FACHB-17]